MPSQPPHSTKSAYQHKGECAEKELKFHYDTIKGRIAETLVQELFLNMNYCVYRYGMENTVPGILELLRGVNSDVAQDIRRMPDFVIQHKESKEVYFIEVKFRADGYFDYKGLKSNYPYPNAFVILVSKKHIKCLSVKELQASQCFTPDCCNYLGNRREFDLDRDLVLKYCQFAVQFFQHV
ncbi:MAG TPA: hypothetical protein VG890_13875 [Puia sp.]|nr:hypothetical protein [Puia sp.]